MNIVSTALLNPCSHSFLHLSHFFKMFSTCSNGSRFKRYLHTIRCQIVWNTGNLYKTYFCVFIYCCFSSIIRRYLENLLAAPALRYALGYIQLRLIAPSIYGYKIRVKWGEKLAGTTVWIKSLMQSEESEVACHLQSANSLPSLRAFPKKPSILEIMVT